MLRHTPRKENSTPKNKPGRPKGSGVKKVECFNCKEMVKASAFCPKCGTGLATKAVETTEPETHVETYVEPEVQTEIPEIDAFSEQKVVIETIVAEIKLSEPPTEQESRPVEESNNIVEAPVISPQRTPKKKNHKQVLPEQVLPEQVLPESAVAEK